MEKKEYPLIPMSEITDEARGLSVSWMACEDKGWIGQKHKLASDIMNYSKYENEAFKDRVIEELEGMGNPLDQIQIFEAIERIKNLKQL